METYFYLHGFASSPQSSKAQHLGSHFRAIALPLTTPDLNQGDFYHLTLSRQIQQMRSLLPPTSATLIGSSLGGLTAAWAGEQCLQVNRLVLLAPAFGFLAHWLPRLGKEQVQHWQVTQSLEVYHYGEKKMLPLGYQFVIDAAEYRESQLQRSIPTLILHGLQDDVIPIQSSRDYTAQRPWVQLIELDSDHTLGNVQAEIWQEIQAFCSLN